MRDVDTGRRSFRHCPPVNRNPTSPRLPASSLAHVVTSFPVPPPPDCSTRREIFYRATLRKSAIRAAVVPSVCRSDPMRPNGSVRSIKAVFTVILISNMMDKLAGPRPYRLRAVIRLRIATVVVKYN